MKQGLFESLTGEFHDGTPIDEVPESHRQLKSIMDHLTRIFNTRRGSIPHLVDYGLPDISELYRKLPEGMEELRAAIRKTIEKYEPRITNTKVLSLDSEERDARLIFILSAELRNGKQVRFQTTFSASEPSKIIPWKKPQ
ncbi:type VI secretion system lysozyme-related protein [Chitinispirillum alkaliphilum]|nr:type VI secretion system lysozyme-related protein [Chitinispirillum alkaliphilum]